MVVKKLKPLPNLLCPRCGHTDTVPLRNYGWPIDGDTPNTSLWWCMECHHRFEGPKVSR
jgi:DNA-directed RNA polymerase subunit RPC12/RpoP